MTPYIHVQRSADMADKAQGRKRRPATKGYGSRVTAGAAAPFGPSGRDVRDTVAEMAARAQEIRGGGSIAAR